MIDTDERLLEIRLFKVRAGTREEFDRISREGTLPLMRRCGIEVVAHGPALNDDTGYYLLRAFASEDERISRSQAVYATPEWEQRYEQPVMDMIDSYSIAVIAATREAIDGLARRAVMPS